jgi:MoaA/NifB/PqqE/SkfB family radical SAM enzyme
MKAKLQNRLVDSSKKSDLKQIVPLEAPFVLMVDPSSRCNFQCRFCPTGDRELIKSTGRYQGFMDLATYEKIIDDVREFSSPIKVLRLYKEGEPLMNKRLPEMIKYARRVDRIGRIDTTTNGALLTPRISDSLIEAGIDQINISVNGVEDGQFTSLVRTKVDFTKYVENIRYLYENRGKCEIYIKAIAENLTADDQKKFLDIFGEIADRVFLEHLSPLWPSFRFEDIPMEFTTGHYGQEIEDRAVCPYIFYIMVINSDGSVSLCVQDWARGLVAGSVLEASVRDIWLGERINSHRLSHLEGCRMNDPICGQCRCMSHGVTENIDSNAQAIKDRLIAKEYY